MRREIPSDEVLCISGHGPGEPDTGSWIYGWYTDKTGKQHHGWVNGTYLDKHCTTRR